MPGLADHVLENLRRWGPAEALSGGATSSRPSWAAEELHDAIERLAAGLAELGVTRGEHVGFIADNHDRWIIADLACLRLGAVTVPRAADTSPGEVAFVLEHARCTTLLVESLQALDRFSARVTELPIARIAVLNGESAGHAGWDEVMALGDARKKRGEDLEDASQRDDLATICYTSGTTGNPKGVMLTHANILHNVAAIPHLIRFSDADAYLSFLPTWHMFERTLEYAALCEGMTIHYSSKAAVRRDLPRVRPTIVAGVPRIWEAIISAVVGKIHRETGWRRRLVEWALGGSRAHLNHERLLEGETFDDAFRIRRVPVFLRPWHVLVKALTAPLHLLADRLVYQKIRNALGGNIRYIISGGGALPLHVDEMMTRAGVCLLNGYGLTETSPVVCVRDARRNVLGTSGRLLQETAWRVMDLDGERVLAQGEKGVLWISGPQVMRGYYENEEATTAVLRDGWFCSGDLAALTDEDDVVICGRAKDTLVLRGGENVEPENIEHELRKSPFIADAVVVGHGEKHLGALLVPDAETLVSELPRLEGVEARELAEDEEVGRLLHGEATRLLSKENGFRIFEKVPKIAILAEPFSIEAGTLTPTMKKKRPVIEDHHAALIGALFSDGAPEVVRSSEDR